MASTPEGVELRAQIQNCSCTKHPLWRLSAARRAKFATQIREKENMSNIIDDLKV